MISLCSPVRQAIDSVGRILLTNQYLEEADVLSDSIVVLDHGRVVASGPAEDLKQPWSGRWPFAVNVSLPNPRADRLTLSSGT